MLCVNLQEHTYERKEMDSKFGGIPYHPLCSTSQNNIIHHLYFWSSFLLLELLQLFSGV